MPKIQMRRDTAANWKSVNPTLLAGEWALETDTKKMKVGNGSTAYNSLEYFREEDNEWEKPADWPDIRSGALPNSVYFLVAHSAPTGTAGSYSITSYPQFIVYSTVSNSGTYDIFVDGMKVVTATSGSDTTIDWATLYNNGTLTGGFDVTYPSSLTTHVVRVTPTNSSNQIVSIRNKKDNSGILWAHFTITTGLNLNSFITTYNGSYNCYICEAVTSSTGVLGLTAGNLYGSFRQTELKTLPILDLNNRSIEGAWGFYYCTKLKKIKFRNVGNIYGWATFQNCSLLSEIEIENGSIQLCYGTFEGDSSLKKIPLQSCKSYYSNGGNPLDTFKGCVSLSPIYLDYNEYSNKYGRIGLGGASNARIDGIKGLTVSNEALFNSTTSPQLDVSYTGLDRAALVNLFESMPYNVGYNVVGAPVFDGSSIVGSTSNDFIRTTLSVGGTDSLEFCYKVSFATAPSTWGNSRQLHLGSLSNYSNGIDITPTGVNWYVLSAVDSTNYHVSGTYNWAVNTPYWVKFIREGSTLSIEVSTDGSSFTQLGTYTNDAIANIRETQINIARQESGKTFLGSIDLANTYIKVNGVTWFRGFCKNMVPSGTLVGSPTVTDGVMSGFSGSKYLTLPSASALNVDTMEWNFVFKTGTDVTPASMKYLFGYEDWGCLSIRSSGAFGFTWLKKSTYAWEEYGSGTIHAEANTTYRCNIVFDNTAGTAVVSVKKADGTSVFSETYSNTDARIYGTPVVGMRGNPSTHADNYFNGSVDLNNSYINVNGSRFWTGMVPQVKTVNVIGCTGTPDISGSSAQAIADRNIVLNKGWELTYQ